MNEIQFIQQATQNFLPIYQRAPFVLTRGQGSKVWDSEGRQYIDFFAGIAVCNLGHCHPEVVATLQQQSTQLWHTSNLYYSAEPIELCQLLVEKIPFISKVFLANSGTEANEAALKLMRKWAARRGRSVDERVILTFENSFHGRTFGAMTATGQTKFHQGFEPLVPGFRYAKFNDIDSVKAQIADGKVVGILIEPIQGEGGVQAATPEFLRQVRKLCDEHNILMACDEIQCGMGRTGHLLACELSGVKPDIITLAKGLGSGFPIGAMLAASSCAEALGPGEHGTTFGGNPLAAAVAKTTLRLLSHPQLLAEVKQKSLYIQQLMQNINQRHPFFTRINGEGLMLGFVLKEEYVPRLAALVTLCAQHGLLLGRAGNDVLRLLPALTITTAEIDEGMSHFETALIEWLQDSH